MGTWSLPPEMVALLTAWAAGLNSVRLAPRLPLLFLGVVFASGRRTASSWFRAAGVSQDFRRFYYLLGALGRKVQFLACILLRLVLCRLHTGDHWLFALDDTPTERYGPCVEGAGIHHNPTPGPAGAKFVYGHVWVTLACVLGHPWWGPIALPLLARLYIRQKDLSKLPPCYHWTFQTKLELAADLIAWLVGWLRPTDKPLWLVADGAYAKQPVLKAAHKHQVVLFSRLRKDAALRSVPPGVPAGQKKPQGRPRLYGTQVYSLARRAGQPRGWQTAEVEQYGKRVTKTFKTFLATWQPAGGAIRVVLVQEEDQPDGWVAYFCTDVAQSAETILEVLAQRNTIEQTFKDVKEVWGAGQQQLRNVWANVGAFHLCLWAYTLVEWWAWGRAHAELVDRSASPWDDPDRRPSQQDRRKALRRWGIDQSFSDAGGIRAMPPKIRRLVRGLLTLLT
jgi:DDE superfamily endonuclease